MNKTNCEYHPDSVSIADRMTQSQVTLLWHQAKANQLVSTVDNQTIHSPTKRVDSNDP